MSFINEYISDEDRERYKLDEVDRRFVVGGTSSNEWTIDKEREIYLRHVASGREEFSRESTWTFFWKGFFIVIDLEIVDSKGGMGEPGWVHRKITRMEVPEDAFVFKEDIVFDLERAFTVYKDACMSSRNTTFSVKLDI